MKDLLVKKSLVESAVVNMRWVPTTHMLAGGQFDEGDEHVRRCQVPRGEWHVPAYALRQVSSARKQSEMLSCGTCAEMEGKTQGQVSAGRLRKSNHSGALLE